VEPKKEGTTPAIERQKLNHWGNHGWIRAILQIGGGGRRVLTKTTIARRSRRKGKTGGGGNDLWGWGKLRPRKKGLKAGPIPADDTH